MAVISNGGGGGIRTHETLARLPVFKTGRFNHSRTPPLVRADTDIPHTLKFQGMRLSI